SGARCRPRTRPYLPARGWGARARRAARAAGRGMMEALSHGVVDWGSSSFRLWALDREGRVLGERRSGQGLAVAAAEGFEAVLQSHLNALGVPDGVPVMMCGMVGSRAGWVEAPYLDAPVRLKRLAELATRAPAR